MVSVLWPGFGCRDAYMSLKSSQASPLGSAFASIYAFLEELGIASLGAKLEVCGRAKPLP